MTDELQQISAMLDETPSARTMAEGRERLRAEIAGPATAPARRRRRFSPPRWSLGLGLAGAVAAALAVAVAVPGTAPDDPSTGQTAVRDLSSARTVLLAAADQAVSTPVAQGKYWHVKQMYALPVEVGPRDDRYTMERLHISETWMDKQGAGWVGTRVTGARPRTAADAVAWKRDGSPTKWDLGPGDYADGGNVHLSATPEPGRLTKTDQPEGFMVAERWLTLRQLQTLPTTPDALREKLLSGVGRPADDDRPPAADDRVAAQALSTLLAEVPAPPQVRAAAFKAMAAMPHARSLGQVKDPQGRPGVGIVITESSGRAELTTRFVVDPKTSMILSFHISAGRKGDDGPLKQRGSVYLETGWTDAEPRIPALP